MIFSIMLLVLVFSALAVPVPPHAFYGTAVYEDGNSLTDGTVITAQFNGSDADTAAASSGKYGYGSDSLIITNNDNTAVTITFYANGRKASQEYTFTSGSATELNLVFSGSCPDCSTSSPSPSNGGGGGGGGSSRNPNSLNLEDEQTTPTIPIAPNTSATASSNPEKTAELPETLTENPFTNPEGNQGGNFLTGAFTGLGETARSPIAWSIVGVVVLGIAAFFVVRKVKLAKKK